MMNPQSPTIRLTHAFNALAFAALLVSGIAILLAHPRFYWGEDGYVTAPAFLELPFAMNLDHTDWGRNVHFLAAWVMVVNGLIYLITGSRSGHLRRHLVPARNDLLIRELTADLWRHVRRPVLGLTQTSGYHALQRLIYLGVIVLLLPAMGATGLAMSPGVMAAVPWLPNGLGGSQTARTLHFLLAATLVLFFCLHVLQVLRAGGWHSIQSWLPGRRRRATETLDPVSLPSPARRQLLIGTGVTAGVAVLTLARWQFPVAAHGLFGWSDALTFTVQRLLLWHQPLAREFTPAEISSSFPAINTVNPEDETYQRLRAGGFVDWRLPVTGLVQQPGAFSLMDLKAMPARTQITQHVCEQGWSAIAQWTGVPLHVVLDRVRMSDTAKFVVFRCVDGWWGSLDLFDALHPQTLLAYGMNEQDLPVQHGAPVRLRVERQLGYKCLKYLSSIEVVASVEHLGNGRGSGAAEGGYAWYAGI